MSKINGSDDVFENVAARLRPNLAFDVCESSLSMAAMAIRCFLCTIVAVFALRSKAPEEIKGGLGALDSG